MPEKAQDELVIGKPEITAGEAVVVSMGPDSEAVHARYRAAFDLTLDGIFIADDDGIYVDVNESYCRFLHARRDQLVGRPFRDFIPSEHLAAAQEAFDRLKAAGSFQAEFPLLALDGSIVELEWSSRSHILPGLHMGVARDVTDRKRAEARLAAEHAVTRLLAESESLEQAAPGILDAIRVSVRADTSLLWLPDTPKKRLSLAIHCPRPESEIAASFGEECRAFHFLPGKGLPGRVWATLAPDWIEEIAEDPNFPRARIAARAGLMSAFAFPISSGSQFHGVMEFLTRHRTAPDPVLLNMTSAIGHEIAQFIGRRHAEDEVRRLNMRLRRSVRETHHRVRNNLQVVAAMIDIVKMSGRETVSVSELNHLGGHIRALSVLHELLTGEMRQDDSEEVSMEGALKRLLPVLELTTGGRKITIKAEGVMAPVRTASGLVILINELVTNAAKHGHGEITVLLSSDGVTGSLQVSDDGNGFPEGFDPTIAANTGLDLVESVGRWDLKGRVEYGNHAGGGAVVSVTFPIPPCGDGPQTELSLD